MAGVGERWGLLALVVVGLLLVFLLMWQQRPYNVMDFGAVGDGVADDTAAIVRAVNADRRWRWPGAGPEK